MSGVPPGVLRAPCFELHGAQVRLGAGRAPALDGVNLRILPGERVALIGANGSGKSTLLRCLHGLLPLAQGRLDKAKGQRLAMLFQRPHMLRIKALHNVALGLWLQGKRWGEARALALTALQRVGLADLAQRNGRALSGGQQQRLALARAWALQPHTWLLDEPTASLDPHAKREVEQLIAEFTAGLVDGQPTTLVFASHNLGQVKRLASRVIYLEQGRVLADLPVADFFNPDLLQALCPHAHLFVQGESW
jgi:tungstate transport system ATP-binding protein